MKRAIPQFGTPLPLPTLRVDSKQKTYSFGRNTPFIKLIAVFLIIAGHTVAILGTERTCQRVALNDSLPTNRAKELRSVLAHGRHAQTQFHAQLAYLEVRRGRTHAPARLPQLPAWKAYAASFWDEEHRTPYVDAIELMDDVPEEAENA